MSREIFLNGHFFYGHRLGRYFRPDDLALTVLKKGAFRLLFLFVTFAGQLSRRGKQPVGTEHRFYAPHRLADTIAVLN